MNERLKVLVITMAVLTVIYVSAVVYANASMRNVDEVKSGLTVWN